MTARQKAADGLLWTACHAPLTFCLLTVWVGGMALLARALGRRLQ